MGLSLMMKHKDIFLHVSALENSKLRVLKEEQTIVYDIEEEKDKLQAINIKKTIYRGWSSLVVVRLIT